MKPVQVEVCRGSDIQPYVDRLAGLRLTVFREYPYLYEGTISEEQNYLKMYSMSSNSILVIARDGDKVIGMATAIPLNETSSDYWKIFSDKKIPIDAIFYLGEMVLLKEYRGKGIGSRIYHQLEKLVKERGLYKKITLSEVDRGGDDKSFWKTKGFIKHPELRVYFSWKEIGELKKTRHALVFSSKNL